MMKFQSLKKIKGENIIKDGKIFLKLKNKKDGTAIKSMRNPFRMKNENESIKNGVISDNGTFLSMKNKIIANQ